MSKGRRATASKSLAERPPEEDLSDRKGSPSAAEGAWTLAFVGVGLTLPVWLPVWLAIWRPAWTAKWRRLQAISRRRRGARLAFQLMGATLLIVVGVAFVFVKEFHRPLLELVR